MVEIVASVPYGNSFRPEPVPPAIHVVEPMAKHQSIVAAIPASRRRQMTVRERVDEALSRSGKSRLFVSSIVQLD